MEYINKTALVAEIKRRFDEYSSSILKHYDACKEAKAQELGKILIILDTLEVKEVDFVKEFYTFSEKHKLMDKGIEFADIEKTASFFFQLGLKAVQKGEKI